jgi:D-lactate dehydrogenase
MTGATIAERLTSAGVAPEAVRGRLIDRVARASDASHYLLTPQAVVVAPDCAAVAHLMRVCCAEGLPLTFRSGGTSLSGQAVTAGVLADTRRHFRGIEVLDDGSAVRVEPGATVRAVNSVLRRYGSRLGPDPASEAACTVGGVVANNSSGMSCGIAANTYSTLRAMTFVLPSGTVIDTSERDADGRFAAVEPKLYQGLSELRDRVRHDDAMRATIARLFSMKNTMGYGVNAFLDFDRPADILAHLVVGSEGTLAFVASATFDTVPVLPEAATGLLIFDDLNSATDALPAGVATGAQTIELLDAQSLRVAAADPRAPGRIRDLQVADHAALLVEYQTADRQALDEAIAEASSAFAGALGGDQEFTRDPGEKASLWQVRKGLYAAVAAQRPPGTTALLEDIAVPVDALSETCRRLTVAFDEFEYAGSVIFGHAKDGNVHFMLSERFDDPERVDRYAAFTEAMVDIVLGQGGTLKAEHGTGRVMAPYVRRQYGDDLYDMMCAVKQLCDPSGVLNPGVLLDPDPSRHVQDLKTFPPVEAEVDRCVECGFCEPVCPSRDLTLTPRQRIVTRRAIAAAQQRDRHRRAGAAVAFGERRAVGGAGGPSCRPALERCAAWYQVGLDARADLPGLGGSALASGTSSPRPRRRSVVVR